MPYYRRRYRGRRRRRRYGPKKYCKPRALDYAKAAYSGVRYIKGLVNSEMFHHPVTGTSTPDTSGEVIHITNIAQGDDDNARTGRSVLLKSIFYRISATINASATNTFVRIILLKDNQQVGDSTPSVTSILASASYLSPLNVNSIGRYTVLKDHLFSLDAAKQDTKLIKIYKKLQMHVKYNGTASTDIQKNGIYILFISSEATNTPSLPYNVRLSYHDN